MKRKFALIAFVGLLLAGLASAITQSLPNAVSAQGLAYDQAFVLDLNALGVDKVSMQATYSKTATSTVDFKDGRVSTGTITVGSVTTLTAAPATNQITVPLDASLSDKQATNYLTVSSTSGLTGAYLTFVYNGHSVRLRNGHEWFSTNTTTGTAASIATALNALGDISAARVNSVVNATATVVGEAGNAYTLTSSKPSAIVVNATNFSGGRKGLLSNAIITFNGIPLKQSYTWAAQDTSTGTAAAIAAVLNTLPGLSASASGRVVYATATVSGTGGNEFTLESNTENLTVASANFTGGRAGAKVIIGGVVLEAGVDWTPGATAALTAKAISNAIVANSLLSQVVTSTWGANGVVYATSTAVGVNDFTLSAVPGSALTVSGVAMVAGSASSYSLTPDSATITAASHGLYTGQAVLFSTRSAVALGGLTNQTTYYVTRVDANHFRLASSSTNAVAGNYLFITSSHTTTTEHTFRVATLAATGSAVLKWQVSNDGSTWSDLSISSVTFSTPYTTATSYWQVDTLYAKYLRLYYTAPTTGAVDLAVAINASGLGK